MDNNTILILLMLLQKVNRKFPYKNEKCTFKVVWIVFLISRDHKYQEFWGFQEFHEKITLAQQSFKAHRSDIFLCSCPKTGTTWLKALAFAIITRHKFDHSTSPLLTTLPHECVPFLEKDMEKIEVNRNNNPNFPLVSTHAPYTFLPQSVIASNCKIVYIYRNVKDVIVSHYHFLRESLHLSMEDAPFNEAFDDFYNGNSLYGPYWDHILGYWKASQERPERILFLKYEDMRKDPTNNVIKLAEFIGYPFSIQEANTRIESIIKLCSFENLSNLEVNKTGMHRPNHPVVLENRFYFRKAKVGDRENYFTDEMREKIDKLMDEKLGDIGLILK